MRKLDDKDEMLNAILPNVTVPRRCDVCKKGWFVDPAITSCPKCGGNLSVTEGGAILGKNEGGKKKIWLTR